MCTRLYLSDDGRSTSLCTWFLLSFRQQRRRGLPCWILLRMARHCNRLPRWPLQRCCPRHIECYLCAVCRGFLLPRPFSAAGLSVGPLECDDGIDCGDSMHGLCSGPVRSVQWTSERSSGLCKVSTRHMEWNSGIAQRHTVHQLCTGDCRTCGRSVECSGGMSNLSHRLLLPRRQCTGGLYHRILLSVRHEHE